jgi:dephospho-CoA kinase
MILGITGTIGAGKGTVVDYLVKEKGFAHFSGRDFLIKEIKERDLPINRDNTRMVGNLLRKMYGPACIAELLFAKAAAHTGDSLIESIRTIGEAEFLKANGVKILAVDADRRLRYNRVVLRGSATDDVDFDTFVMHEEREMASTEPFDMNITSVMRMSDFRIENDGSLEELHVQIEEMLKCI